MEQAVIAEDYYKTHPGSTMNEAVQFARKQVVGGEALQEAPEAKRGWFGDNDKEAVRKAKQWKKMNLSYDKAKAALLKKNWTEEEADSILQEAEYKKPSQEQKSKVKYGRFRDKETGEIIIKPIE